MEAMNENREVAITYQKYTSQDSGSYTLRPYAVKEFAKRWYIIGYCLEREALRVYGLDRVHSLDILEERFEMEKGFDVDELFATSFGIYLPEEAAKTITFRTSATEAKYLRDLPIHSSQEEVSSDGRTVTFSIFVCPNRNLIMEFCKYGDRLEVLSPESIRNQVASQLISAAALYGGTQLPK